MPSRETIENILSCLSAYCSTPKTANEMRVLCMNWEEDLCALDDADLIRAVQEYCKGSSFFPTSSHILKSHRALAEREAAGASPAAREARDMATPRGFEAVLKAMKKAMRLGPQG